MIHFTKVNGYLVQLESDGKKNWVETAVNILGGIAVALLMGSLAVAVLCF